MPSSMWGKGHGPGQMPTSGRPSATVDSQESRYEDKDQGHGGGSWVRGRLKEEEIGGQPLTPPWPPRPAPKCARSWTSGPVVAVLSPCTASNTWLLWRLILERRV